jgi:hypothetical protein
MSVIKYFPEPYPDEILYSIIARYSRITLTTSPKELALELFNSSSVPATIDLPSHLIEFQKNTVEVFPYSVDRIIESFTLYPFYRPFLQLQKREKIINSMMGNVGWDIHTRVGINASKIVRPRYPKFCPACLTQDVIQFGEAYWHRMHQIPDMCVCPTHLCFLISHQPELNEFNRSLYLAVPHSLRKTKELRFNNIDAANRVAQVFAHLLNGQDSFDINKVCYLERARQTGYLKHKSLDFQRLSKDFERHFGNDFLENALCNLSDHFSWIQGIIKRPYHFFHPLRHILIEDFFNSRNMEVGKRHEPFGEGPWPCLNKASNHYGENVVTKKSIHIDGKSKRLIGRFECSCGMIYTKSFLHRNGGIEEFVRIKEWGIVWAARLLKEYKCKKSLRSIAAMLGTDAKTISLQFAKVSNPPSKKNPHSLLIHNYRKKWRTKLNKFTDNKILNARRALPTIYSWLYRNDKNWLMIINKLHEKQNYSSELRLNWKQLDENLINQLAIALGTLRKRGYKKQITRTILAKIINHEKYLFRKNLRKLPLSSEYLNANCETRIEFQIRRIKMAKSALVLSNEEVAEWKIMRKAGLRKNVTQEVIDEIEKAVKFA